MQFIFQCKCSHNCANCMVTELVTMTAGFITVLGRKWRICHILVGYTQDISWGLVMVIKIHLICYIAILPHPSWKLGRLYYQFCPFRNSVHILPSFLAGVWHISKHFFYNNFQSGHIFYRHLLFIKCVSVCHKLSKIYFI